MCRRTAWRWQAGEGRSRVHRSGDNRHLVEEPFSARPSQRGGSLSITRSHYFPGAPHQLSLRRHPGVCTPCCGPRGSTGRPWRVGLLSFGFSQSWKGRKEEKKTEKEGRGQGREGPGPGRGELAPLTLLSRLCAEYKECFSLYDKEQRGRIKATDLLVVMRCLGASPTPGEVQRHLQSHKIGEWAGPEAMLEGMATWAATCGCGPGVGPSRRVRVVGA